MMLWLLLSSSLALAGVSRLPDPRAAYKQNLELLERKCAGIPKLAERAPRVCGDKYMGAVSAMKSACDQVLLTYEDAWPQAVALIFEAVAWRAKKSMVQDNGKTLIISFSLSSDPTYPFHNGDKITNGALAAANQAISEGGAPIRQLEKARACKGAKREIETLWQEWEGERSGENIVDFHNALGMGIGNFLLQAQRSMEAGAHDEAMKAFAEEAKRK